jgi:hypothetical protein
MFKKNNSMCFNIAQARSALISVANSALLVTINTMLTKLLLALPLLLLLGVFP